MIKVDIQTLAAQRDSALLAKLHGLSTETLTNLQAALNPVPDYLLNLEFWPEEAAEPSYNAATQKLGDEILTPDPVRKVVVVAREVVEKSPEEFAAFLESLRISKREDMAVSYAAAATADIEFNTFSWKTDQASVALLAQVISVGSVPPSMYWRDASGTPRTMTFADLQALGYAILARNLAADNNHQTKLALIANATTVSDINLITW